MQKPSGPRTGSSLSMSKRTISTRNLLFSQLGMRPTAPILPSKLKKTQLPSVAAYHSRIFGMRKRRRNSSQMSGRSPLPQARRILCRRLLRMRRAVQEVAAEFADVDGTSCIRAARCRPRTARRRSARG